MPNFGIDPIPATSLRIVLITSDFYPHRSSAAVQMRDLAHELSLLGHEPLVLVPSETIDRAWLAETIDGTAVLRLAAPRFRDVGFVRRALAEMMLPFAILLRMRSSPFWSCRWDAIAWYSPPIFFGPLVFALKQSLKCRAYLILRDIFPEWAFHLRLMRRGPAYWFFKAVAYFQYAVADVIGVQSPSNMPYLSHWTVSGRKTRRLEVLWNWLANVPNVGSSIVVANTMLAGRTIFVYAGNMGVAQNAGIFISLAESLRHRDDIGFLFVGRGSEAQRLSSEAGKRSPRNILFCDEVDSREMPGLLAQCHVGLLSLDLRHRTHNIPGKFLTYIQAGLPVLARINNGTDLADIIEKEGVGRACVEESMEALRVLAEKLADDPDERRAMAARGRVLCTQMFSPRAAANQIVSGLVQP